MLAAAERGEIVLGGCSITGDDPTRHCKACDQEFGGRRLPPRPPDAHR